MTNPYFVQFKTDDGLLLPGLLFEASKSNKTAVYLHGNGSSSVFYSDYQESYSLASSLQKRGISLLMFNNRGAHYIKKLDVSVGQLSERKLYGMAYERIKECIIDIDAAVSFLETRKYRHFYLIGASTGANKICVYNYYSPKNLFSKYVLIAGGDDTGIYYFLLGKKKIDKLIKKSKEKIKRGQGEQLIKELLPEMFFSYRSFFDTCNPDGDYNCFPFLEVIKKIKLSKKKLFRYYSTIKKPTLVIYGEKDEYAWGGINKCVNILKKYQPEFDYQIIKGADHGFTGYKKQLGEIVAQYLTI